MLNKNTFFLLAAIILFTITPVFAATIIPAQAWSRDINAGGANIDGAPIGGFGAGTISWRFNGNFYKTRLNIGEGGDSPTAFVNNTNCKFYLYQKPASGAATNRTLDSSVGSNQATYYSLFPKSWVDYYGSQFTVKAKVTQFSPIIPGDYQRVSYPVGIYEWELTNPTAENLDAAIMLTWQNDDFSGANAQAVTSGNYRGIVLRSGIANPTNKNQGEFCLGTEAAAGTTVSYMSAAALGTITTDFSADGVLANTVGNNTIGGIAFKVTLAPGASVKIPIVLSWDIPIFQMGTGYKWYREYTRHWTRTGQNSWAIAQDSLANHDSYESQIDSWQNTVLTNPNYPAWLKSMLFNEMYIYFTGGTVWEAGAASGQNDNASEDMFSHLESYIYDFYGTSDVRFYGSWALLMNWPDIDKQAVKQFADSVYHTRTDRPPYLNTTAHDIGGTCLTFDTTGEPVFELYNAYTWRDSTNWKDLNSKLVLMIYRDWLLTGGTDSAFLTYCWEPVKRAMTKVKSQDSDADGLPNSAGIDQTYDDMDLTGDTSYCGSLFLAACQAAKQIALEMGDNAQAATYQSWYDLAQPNFESQLWNGTYYNIDTGSFDTTRVMSDQLCGHWYSKTLGLGGIVTDAHAVSAWQEVYDNNFSSFGGGAHGVCNVMNPNNTIDTSSPQTQESWVGTSWGVVSGMVHQGMTTQANAIGQSLYNSIWANSVAYWFRTPEAWRVGLTGARAFYYMRGTTLWAAKRAYDIVQPVASPTNTPNWTATPTRTRTPIHSPTVTITLTPTATINMCVTSYRRINCGGPAATDSLGRAWVVDQAWVAGGYGYVNGLGIEGIVTNAIANTNDDVLYQSGRYGGGLEYRFTVPNGPWRVILKFAEIYTFTNPGQRVFNVSIEGAQVLSNYDIIQETGARFAAVDEVFDITVADGIIDILFTNGTADVPKIDAIEIVDLSTVCSPTVTSTNLPGTSTNTRTRTPTGTATRTATGTPTRTVTRTATRTATDTPYFSPTFTATNTPFISSTPTRTRTNTPQFTATNTFTITRTFTNTPVVTPIRVNCAGTVDYISGVTGFTWVADQAYTPGGWGYNIAGNTNDRSTQAIANTQDDRLYQLERWNATLEYLFTIPDGVYEVTLKFADTYTGTQAVGARQFNVAIEGIQVETNFDIYAIGGGMAAVDRVYIVTVSDGLLDIDLTSGAADSPLINAIQILRFTPTATVTPSRTATDTRTPAYTFTRTATQTPTGSATGTGTITSTASNTGTSTASSTPTFTYTQTRTNTPLNTYTYTATRTSTAENTYTRTVTRTNTEINTPTYTYTRTASATVSPTYTGTATRTASGTATVTDTQTSTGTRTPSVTPTNTPTATRTVSPIHSPTETVTGTPPTETATPTVTGTFTASPTYTVTNTCTETVTHTASPTLTVTETVIQSATFTRTCTPEDTLTNTPVDTETDTPTNTPTDTFTETATGTFTVSQTHSVSPSITQTVTGTPPTETMTPTVTASYTVSGTPSLTATPSLTSTNTPVDTATFTHTVTTVPYTPTPTPTGTEIAAPSPTPWVCEIIEPVVYPNPYNAEMGNLRISMTFTRQMVSLKFRIYTVALRKVLEYEIPLAGESGDYVMTLPYDMFERFSSGVYYYRLYGRTAQNEEARSKSQKLLVIKYH